MIDRGDGIVIGLSGGADSVFLCFFLQWLSEEWELKLGAVHVNHGIRGQEADRDQEFCASLAGKLGIPFLAVQVNIPEYAREQGISQEAAGRCRRYQILEQQREQWRFQKIAVAHHQDDQVETVIFQLMRGSSLRGLGGMRPIRDRIIRPMLCVRRSELQAQLTDSHISWCEDSTNEKDEYTRNRMRHHVLPMLEEYGGEGVVCRIAQTAEQLRDVYKYICQETATVYEKVISGPNEVSISLDQGKVLREVYHADYAAVLALPMALQREFIMKWLGEAAGGRKDFAAHHVESMLELMQGPTGKRLFFPYQLVAGKDYDQIWMGKCEETEKEDVSAQEYSWETFEDFELKQCIFFSEWERKNVSMIMELLPRRELSKEVPKNNCTKWFDYARIKGMLKLRHPLPGDSMQIAVQGKHKKISRIMIDAKVPLEQRKKLWVLAVGNRVLWIPELGRSGTDFYVEDKTEMVLCVRYELQEEKRDGN